MYFSMDPADYLQAKTAGDVVARSTAILMVSRFSAMLIAACRYRVACRWLVCDDRIYKFRCGVSHRAGI
jgi:hypothetical protein